MEHLLEVRDLHVRFRTHSGYIYAVRGVDLYVDKGETLAIVGESGSGKSVSVKSIIGLLPEKMTEITSGTALYKGTDLLALPPRALRKYRGKEISMIFQDPMTSLNPTTRCRKQITEGARLHLKLSRREAARLAVELLETVGIPQPEVVAKRFPHQLSGGMRQRVMIALALACKPALLFADEPTTALDVTIQAQIMELLKKLQRELDLGVILITHDLGVIADNADRIAVMYAGLVVECGTNEEIFYSPQHPYTAGLLEAIPRLDADDAERLATIHGMPPQLRTLPDGCPFAPRCGYAMEICARQQPPNTIISPTQQVRCWLMHENAGPEKARFDADMKRR